MPFKYVYPEKMFEFAVKNLSPFVSLRHDRIPYDFTLFVYKNKIWIKEKNI